VYVKEDTVNYAGTTVVPRNCPGHIGTYGHSADSSLHGLGPRLTPALFHTTLERDLSSFTMKSSFSPFYHVPPNIGLSHTGLLCLDFS
jgi:hypothetical protein